MSPPDAARPRGGVPGPASENVGDDLDTEHTHPHGYVLRGDVLEPEGVPAHMPVPNRQADAEHDPVPIHVAALLRDRHRCEPYPPKHPRHHIGIWELYVARLPLTSQAKAVAWVLTQHWPTVRPSRRRIQDLSGLSRMSVDRGLKVLELSGLLAVDETRGPTTNTYRPQYPARDVTAAEVKEMCRWLRLPVTAPPDVPPGRESMCSQGAAMGPQGASDLPPRGPEVVNEAHTDVRDEVLADFVGLRRRASAAALTRRLERHA